MLPDSTVPLRDDSPGCVLETRGRSIQNTPEVFWVSLNREWLSQLDIAEQGALTLHSLATRPVEVTHPAIIIQPHAVIEG